MLWQRDGGNQEIRWHQIVAWLLFVTFLCGLSSFHIKTGCRGFWKKTTLIWSERGLTPTWSGPGRTGSPPPKKKMTGKFSICMCGKRNLTCETGGEYEKGRILRIEASWRCDDTWKYNSTGRVFLFRGFRNTYLSWGFLQVEAEDVGRDVAVLQAPSFTLPSGLFTPLEGKMKRVPWGRGSFFFFLKSHY